MIKEAINYLVQIGQKTPQVLTVHVDPEKIHKLICHGDGKTELMQFDQQPVNREHQIFSLEDFIEYLNSDHCKNDNGIVFVEEKQAIADLAYRIHQTQRVVLPLENSVEYDALLKLTTGVGQKELWKLLITDLDGCLPESLLAAISVIQVSSKTEGNCEIKLTGESSSRSNSGLKVTFQPKEGAELKETTIPLDWEWKGRIWECFDRVCAIKLRLEIDTDAGLRFIFNPRKMAQTLIEQRACLVEHLQEKISARFQIYQGNLDKTKAHFDETTLSNR